MKVRQLSKLLCTGLISGAFLFGGVSEAGIVTDRLPLQCYADHQVNTYNSPSASKRAGYISANVDLIQITQVRGDGWCYGSYPGAGGKRVSRWFKITDVCADAGYTNRSANVKGKQTVYRTRSGGSILGSVSNNESVIVVADNGSRAQIVYRLDNGTGYKLGWVPSSSVKAPAHAQQSHNPEGNFEGVSSPAANQIRVEGWAADRDNMGTSLRIHVYVGGGLGSGAESYEILANKSRTDVRSWFASQGIPAGEFYGFNNVIGVNRTGRQDIYVYAINVGGGDNIELGHKTVNIQSTQQPVAQEKAGYIKTNGANLNFRQTPNGTILGKLSNGTSITVLQHPATNGWSKIRYNGREGYVASQYVAIGNSPSQLNSVSITNNRLSSLISSMKGKYFNDRISANLGAGSSCFGFANYIFNELHGTIVASNLSHDDGYTLYNIKSGVRCSYTGYADENKWHELLQQCKPGDFIQTSSGKGSYGSDQHSMVFVSYNPSTKVLILFDANFVSDKKQYNLIQERSTTLSKFANLKKGTRYRNRYTSIFTK